MKSDAESKVKPLRVSIVIPVYNEAGHLDACLRSIASQSVKPYEVIVVDNNSTDDSVAIACRYPFVTLLREARQGLVYARTRGYDAAKGDIIGRTDGDSVLAPDWTERVQQAFATNAVDAVSGGIWFLDVPFKRFFERIELGFRTYLAYQLSRRNELFLYGSNMALRRNVWHELKRELCVHGGLHEDMDIAAHMAHRYKVIFDEHLLSGVSARRIDSGIGPFIRYVTASSNTYAAHYLRGRFYMYPIEAIVIIFYAPLRFLYRIYDPDLGRFSLAKLFSGYHSEARIDPTIIET